MWLAGVMKAEDRSSQTRCGDLSVNYAGMDGGAIAINMRMKTNEVTSIIMFDDVAGMITT